MPDRDVQGRFINCKDEKNLNWKGGMGAYYRQKARKLLNNPKGVVHHINGNVRDNRLENLIILSSQSEHIALHNKQRKGTIKPNSKIRQIIKDVLKLKKQGSRRKEISNKLDISFRMVKRCLTHKWRCQYE